MTQAFDSAPIRRSFEDSQTMIDLDLHYIYGQRRSNLASYDRTFHKLLGESGLVGLVMGLACHNESSENLPLVVDLLAPTDTLIDLQTGLGKQGLNVNGAAVSLESYGPEGEPIYHDTVYGGISHVQGDLSRASTWNKLEIATNGQKADLILERATAGIDRLPLSVIFAQGAIRRVWAKLRPGGIFLGQTWTDDTLAEAGLPTMLQLTRHWNEHGVESYIDKSMDPNYSVLMLKKPDGRSLPMPTADIE